MTIMFLDALSHAHVYTAQASVAIFEPVASRARARVSGERAAERATKGTKLFLI